jgi:SH3 domain-containing YSC84-like protein 1
MRRVVLLAPFLILGSWLAWAADGAKELDAAAQVIQKMASSNQLPSSLLSHAKCVAIIPKMTKAGFMVGGKHGNGVVACRTASGWSAPAFISITGGSVGFQAGAEQQDLVLLMNAQGEQELRNGHWDLGAEAVAAGPTGGTGSELSTGWKAPVLSYSSASGAFAGADIGGSKIGTDNDTIHATYGESASLEGILDGTAQPPASAQKFISALQQAAGK